MAGNQSINWPPLHLSVEPVSPRSLLDTSITAHTSHWPDAATAAANEDRGCCALPALECSESASRGGDIFQSTCHRGPGGRDAVPRQAAGESLQRRAGEDGGAGQ